MRYTLLLLSSILFWLALPAEAAKPRQPLQVRIVPLQPGKTVQAGETAEVQVFVRSAVASKELRLKLELLGSATLVSGPANWVGPIAKGEEKMFPVTVLLGPGGGNRLMAHAAIIQSKTATFAASGEHRFAPVQQMDKPRSPPPPQQDIFGRQIREYRSK